MATFTDKLDSITQEIDTWITEVNTLSCTDDRHTLSLLAAKFGDIATAIEKKLGTFRPIPEGQAWKASEHFRTKAQSAKIALLNADTFNGLIFKRNIIQVFSDVEISDSDAKRLKFKKLTMRKRCETIRNLDPDAIVAWAISYPPTSWNDNMTNNVFDCLVEDIKANGAVPWPSLISAALHKFREEGSIKLLSEYNDFLSGNSIKR
jgi:hypothetical protein